MIQNTNLEVVTTFNRVGWKRYGQRMVSTFVKYWPRDIKLYVYAENLKEFEKEIMRVKDDRVVVQEIFDLCPQIKTFLKNYDNPTNRGVRYVDGKNTVQFRLNGITFCYKVYAQCHRIRNSTAKKLIYLDGDTLTFANPPMHELDKILPNDCLTTYLGRGTIETNKRTPFAETGFMYYNLEHPNIQEFADTFEDLYTSGKIWNLRYQVDCWVFDIARKQIEEKYNVKSFNLGGGKLGKKHPFVNSILGTFMDHLKGTDRKNLGHSKIADFKDNFVQERKQQEYWKAIKE